MMIKQFLALLLFPLLLSCSIFENEQDFEIYPPNIIGEWIRTDFAGDTEYIKPSSIDTSLFKNYILYNFNDNYSCEMNSGLQPSNNSFYSDCGWSMYGEDPNIYLTTQFSFASQTFVRAIYWDFYKVTELSEDRISLRLLDSNHGKNE